MLGGWWIWLSKMANLAGSPQAEKARGSRASICGPKSPVLSKEAITTYWAGARVSMLRASRSRSALLHSGKAFELSSDRLTPARPYSANLGTRSKAGHDFAPVFH